MSATVAVSGRVDDAGIAVERVARSFGEVRAIREATFEVHPGEVTALVGPNGSGKTTLLLMLASLLAPDAGTIRIAGIDPMVDPVAVRRVIGWMPDTLGSWPNLTARETLVLTARLYGIEPPSARERAAELLSLVDLGELADRPTRVLSRGQKQRLSLARGGSRLHVLHRRQVQRRDEHHPAHRREDSRDTLGMVQ
jgi:ABC-type multidrug transport system ATPase subunit